jgi:ectoine hydroxylase-related dioxygenase (phytanoyl-CoA dioxygenase family)
MIRSGDDLVAGETPFFRETEDGSDGFRHLVELEPAFDSLVANDAVLAFVVAVLGTNIHLSSSQLSYLEPGAHRDRRPPWHTDIHGVEDDLGTEQLVRLGLKCCFYLTDHPEPRSGSTVVVPGSHHLRSPLHLPPGEADPVAATEATVNAGDCIVFDMRLRHRAGTNKGTKVRKSVLLGYTYRWVAPLDDPVDPEGLRERLAEPAADLIPRPYRAPDSGGLLAFADQHGIAARPAQRLP